MIFDTPKMQELLSRYQNQPDFMVPEIVFLARTARFNMHRACLEKIFVRAPETKRSDWLGRILSIDHEQYRGAWFEMMLFNWLKELGAVEIEPIIEGNYPDYSVEIDKRRIIIEARAILETTEERENKKFEEGISWALRQIEKPFDVLIVDSRFSEFPDWSDFQRQVSGWLETIPNERFIYETDAAIIVLETLRVEGRAKDHVTVTTNPGMPKQIISKPIKSPLREKASQHKAIRSSGHPYVIALYLEPIDLSEREVVRAWFGEEVWTVNISQMEVVDSRLDRSGIHFIGSDVRHTTVSGTLVFKSGFSESEKCTFLQAWYVENPFAKTPIDPSIFPVYERYIVIDKSDEGCRMAWVKPNDGYLWLDRLRLWWKWVWSARGS